MTLTEWDELRRAELILGENWQHPNGISCPSCARELFDTSLYDQALPPRMQVICNTCDFTGSRLV